MDWSKGFSASYYMAIVDPVTWRDVDRVEITGGDISKSDDKLRESASVDCVDYDIQQERWIRLWLDAKQEEDSEHVALFTGLAVSPSVSIEGRLREYPLECYSVLKPADDVLLGKGWYAAEGFDGGSIIKDLLSVIPAPVIVEGDPPRLAQAIIAEDKETCLTMVDKVLDAINWRMKISGDGTITVCAKNADVVATFGCENDVIEPSVSIKHDWYECPNVFRVVSDDQYAIARDDDPDSFLSTVSRGREVWAEDDNADLNEGESIAECALRMLREAQSAAVEISYDRRYNPNVSVGDTVRLHYPGSGLEGDFTVAKQTIDLGHGATVSEEVQR